LKISTDIASLAKKYCCTLLPPILFSTAFQLWQTFDDELDISTKKPSYAKFLKPKPSEIS
jgi:hypothetical protein